MQEKQSYDERRSNVMKGSRYYNRRWTNLKRWNDFIIREEVISSEWSYLWTWSNLGTHDNSSIKKERRQPWRWCNINHLQDGKVPGQTVISGHSDRPRPRPRGHSCTLSLPTSHALQNRHYGTLCCLCAREVLARSKIIQCKIWIAPSTSYISSENSFSAWQSILSWT
jgi:hypothetical protein